jgi:hypothetical protein
MRFSVRSILILALVAAILGIGGFLVIRNNASTGDTHKSATEKEQQRNSAPSESQTESDVEDGAGTTINLKEDEIHARDEVRGQEGQATGGLPNQILGYAVILLLTGIGTWQILGYRRLMKRVQAAENHIRTTVNSNFDNLARKLDAYSPDASLTKGAGSLGATLRERELQAALDKSNHDRMELKNTVDRLEAARDEVNVRLRKTEKELEAVKRLVSDSERFCSFPVPVSTINSLDSALDYIDAVGRSSELRLEAASLRESLSQIVKEASSIRAALNHCRSKSGFSVKSQNHLNVVRPGRVFPVWATGEPRLFAVMTILEWARAQALNEIAAQIGSRVVVPVPGEPFQSRLHEARDSVETTDPSLDGRIAECIDIGFEGQLLATVKRYELKSTVSANEEVSGDAWQKPELMLSPIGEPSSGRAPDPIDPNDEEEENDGGGKFSEILDR